MESTRRALVGTRVVATLGLTAALAILPALASLPEQKAETASSTDAQRDEIAKTAEAFVDAFQKEDAKACAGFWAPDGDYTDLDGRVMKGREAIEKDFAQVFAANDGLKVRIEIGSIRFPTPDTAIEDGVTSVMAANGGLPNRARYTNFLVKRDGKWLLTSVHESAYVPPSNADHLRPLDWMIGEWAQDTKDPHAGRVIFEWTPDRNFIMGSRAIAVDGTMLFSGTERLGWDAAGKFIRSWSFEADGGFAEGTWKAQGDNAWAVATSTVLANGSLMTSTNTITRTDANTVTWQATGRTLDGKPLPDSSTVTMKRVN